MKKLSERSYFIYFVSLILVPAMLLGGCMKGPLTEPSRVETVDDTAAADESEAIDETEAVEEAENVSEEPDDGLRLCSAVTAPDALGEDSICGTCINQADLSDERIMELIYEHFNAVTLENELKPDAMFGYHNDHVPAQSIHEEELNGTAISVPTLDHSRADAILDAIAKHNTDCPDRPIRVRGHVLVWHQQTPEWFFHVDYDKDKDYVSADEMNRRMEWYIKTMLEYYTGEGSKYRDLFYGWDVVNEAVSDRSGTYRNHTEGSSWWKVYNSSEYILNAFIYANKYAPDDLDLYYNDYNECDKKKKEGILTLINDVKSAEGARLDGFGMQAHYTVNAPAAEAIDLAAREYAQAAGKVMLTELDVKASMFYRGTDEDRPKEYDRQAVYYKSIYDVLKKLHKDGINLAGLSFWGVTDTRSWLGSSHCPLLFDGQYKAKPAFYVFF